MFLEIKEDGEQQVIQHPSLEGFIAFLKTKEPSEHFMYSDPCHCAVGQYTESYGRSWVTGRPSDHTRKDWEVYLRLNGLAACSNKTFGSVLARAQQAA